jgi:SpoVK/Ycf46/Vps4 family AAA+-type ATPase
MQRPGFLISYTDRALAGEFQPAIGREQLIQQIVATLKSRSGEQHPMLLGPPGVGKTQLVQAIALSIAKDRSGLQVYEVDQTSFAADASYVNQTEGRLKMLLDFAQSEPNSVFFIDEFHRFIGTGSTSHHQSGVEQLLKPAMTNGSIKIIAATTLDEYERFVKSDSALDRRFSQFQVPSLNSQFTVDVLNVLNRQEKVLGKPNFSPALIKLIVDTASQVESLGATGEPARSIKLFSMLRRHFLGISTSGAILKSDSASVLKKLLTLLKNGSDPQVIKEELKNNFSGTPGAIIDDAAAIKALQATVADASGVIKGAA